MHNALPKIEQILCENISHVEAPCRVHTGRWSGRRRRLLGQGSWRWRCTPWRRRRWVRRRGRGRQTRPYTLGGRCSRRTGLQSTEESGRYSQSHHSLKVLNFNCLVATWVNYFRFVLTLVSPAGSAHEGGRVAEGICHIITVCICKACDTGAGGSTEGATGAKCGHAFLARGACNALSSRAQRGRVGVARTTAVWRH